MTDGKSLERATTEDHALAVFASTDVNIGTERAKLIGLKLRDIVVQRNLAVRIGKSFHLTIEAWNACGALVGVVAKTEWTRIERDPTGRFEGCMARVQVVSIRDGSVISAAENACYVEEQTKKRSGGYYHRWVENCDSHDEPTLDPCGLPNRHAIVSMAQTRAASKALAQVLRWITVMAGFAGTPAEEMTSAAAENQESGQAETIGADLVEILRARIKETSDGIDGVSENDIETNVCTHFGFASLSEVPEIRFGEVVKAIVSWDGPLDAA